MAAVDENFFYACQKMSAYKETTIADWTMFTTWLPEVPFWRRMGQFFWRHYVQTRKLPKLPEHLKDEIKNFYKLVSYYILVNICHLLIEFFKISVSSCFLHKTQHNFIYKYNIWILPPIREWQLIIRRV